MPRLQILLQNWFFYHDQPDQSTIIMNLPDADSPHKGRQLGDDGLQQVPEVLSDLSG